LSSRVWLGTVISLVTVGDLRYCFSGEKKWQAIRRWRSRSLMEKDLSCGSSRWKIFWWIEISGSLVDPGTTPTGTSADDWKKTDQKAKSTIRLCLSDSVLLNVSEEATAKDLWEKLGSCISLSPW
jgi:hypothetical protein